MDFFDNAMTKAKEALDVACKKTNEVVNTQKQKFDVASLENKRAKDFEVLGQIYYNKIKDGSISDSNISDIILSIDEKNNKIKALKEEINNAKNKRFCPKCGASIDINSNYCNACGEKVVFESEEENND